jgi:hypothetical protein
MLSLGCCRVEWRLGAPKRRGPPLEGDARGVNLEVFRRKSFQRESLSREVYPKEPMAASWTTGPLAALKVNAVREIS